MSSYLGDFTSNSNKSFMSAYAAQSAQGLGLVLTCSHNSSLSTQLNGFAPEAWISQIEVGESSRGCWNVI
jgi:hypothetical protein